jgi:UDP-glucose 4-epimerase
MAKSVLGWTAEFRDIRRIVETAWTWHQRPSTA